MASSPIDRTAMSQFPPDRPSPTTSPGRPPIVLAWSKFPAGLRVVVVVAALVAGFFAWQAVRGSGAPEGVDVTVTSCTSSGSSATAGLEVVNNTSTTRSVRIGLEYRDASGARLDTDATWVRDLAPGDTARPSEVTFLGTEAPAGLSCAVTDVR
jgi:hypothetical protein